MVFYYDAKRFVFFVRSQASLVRLRVQMVVASAVVWYVKKILLLRILCTARRPHDVLVYKHFYAPLASRTEQLTTAVDAGVVNVNLQPSAKAIVILIRTQSQKHRPWRVFTFQWLHWYRPILDGSMLFTTEGGNCETAHTSPVRTEAHPPSLSPAEHLKLLSPSHKNSP